MTPQMLSNEELGEIAEKYAAPKGTTTFDGDPPPRTITIRPFTDVRALLDHIEALSLERDELKEALRQIGQLANLAPYSSLVNASAMASRALAGVYPEAGS